MIVRSWFDRFSLVVFLCFWRVVFGVVFCLPWFLSVVGLFMVLLCSCAIDLSVSCFSVVFLVVCCVM